ncbi:uncharacterized protein LOC106011983 [Aplysia californica]|uniref:Uncharacterized protein LOC106011983 n=1 Tax=Aplysia californica TaxID=6500 RepID=A0ABM1VUI7_APLCA|nr:uncharacterized protein LOC106011983 [Aplysia californica]
MFQDEELQELRCHFMSLERAELDMVVLAKISCGIHLSAFTIRPKQKSQTERKASRTDYFHHGQRICRDTFTFIHAISREKLTALIVHYKEHGISPRQHGNLKKLPSNSLSFKDTRNVVDFIVNYAEDHAIMLPGRTPHNWVSDVKLLPTNCSKKSVFDQYSETLSSVPESRVVSYRSFRRIWAALLPFIRTMPPATDLCWVCQQDAAKLTRVRNESVETKTAVIKDIEQHLFIVTSERSYFRFVCDTAKQALPEDIADFGVNPPCSYDGVVHYSFDFAQQVQYPSNPLQPGPIYFKTPRKCGLFGIHCEALSKQINYLIDEACSPGKGADCVISLLHHFLSNYGLGEQDLHIHADNCSGQNKNSAMMNYLLWRVMTGRHRSIKMSFLITGHTKFSPDWCFGLFKKRLRRTKVDSMQCIAAVVESSSTSNLAHVIGPDPNTASVSFFKWTEFLGQYFRKVKDIKANQHFHFSQDGLVVKKFSSSPEVTLNIVKTRVPLEGMPNVISLPGLDNKRQNYLYQEIRPFVQEEFKDIVCPKPVVATPDNPPATVPEEPNTPPAIVRPKKQPAKKRRKQ